MYTSPSPFNPVSDHAGTAMSGTVTFAKPVGAREIMIQCQSGTARYTFGTVTPGTATGFQLRAGDAPVTIPIFGTAVKIAPEAGTITIAYQWGG
jgi:hypothetical protein